MTYSSTPLVTFEHRVIIARAKIQYCTAILCYVSRVNNVRSESNMTINPVRRGGEDEVRLQSRCKQCKRAKLPHTHATLRAVMINACRNVQKGVCDRVSRNVQKAVYDRVSFSWDLAKLHLRLCSFSTMMILSFRISDPRAKRTAFLSRSDSEGVHVTIIAERWFSVDPTPLQTACERVIIVA